MKGRVIIGFILLVLGIGFLLDELNLWTFGEFVSTWWPSLLILLGVVQLATRSISPLGGGLLVTIGVLFQLDRLDLLPADWTELLWPVLLILVGGWLILSVIGATGGAALGTRKGVSQDARIERTVAFGGLVVKSRSQAFEGGNVTAMFGGAEVDLHDAQLAKQGAELVLTAMFGGVEVHVPEAWPVVVDGTPIFGGVDNQTKGPATDGEEPVLRVRATALFGGCEVNNEPAD